MHVQYKTASGHQRSYSFSSYEYHVAAVLPIGFLTKALHKMIGYAINERGCRYLLKS